MSATTRDVQLESQPEESFGSNIAGIFSFLIDSKGAATRLFTRWFWIFPLALFVIVSIVGSVIVTPIIQHVLETQPMPTGANPETYARGIQTGLKLQRIASFLFPIVSVLLQALVLWGMASVVAINATYRQMLNLAAGGSIFSVLAAIAGVLILKLKGEVSTMAELRPALGLDIFLPESTNKFVMALVGYFSIFEIWWIVMMVLILAAAYRIGKGKAFTVLFPLALISLVFRLVGAAFQRTP